MQYKLSIFLALVASWLVWSGHFQVWETGFHHYFLLVLGLFSCLFCVWLTTRMKILDEEGVPVQLGVRPFIAYFPWLLKEIVVSNIAVTKIILSPKMKLQRAMVEVKEGMAVRAAKGAEGGGREGYARAGCGHAVGGSAARKLRTPHTLRMSPYICNK